jgi:chitinase
VFRRSVPLIAVLVVLAAPTAAQAAGLSATFSKSSDWGSGFVADYTIKNTGSTTVNGWRLEFDVPPARRSTAPGTGS